MKNKVKENKKSQPRKFNYKKLLLAIFCVSLLATSLSLFRQRGRDFEVNIDKKFIKDVCFNFYGLNIEKFYIKNNMGYIMFMYDIKNNNDSPVYQIELSLIDSSLNRLRSEFFNQFIEPGKTISIGRSFDARDLSESVLNKHFFPCIVKSPAFVTKWNIEKLKNGTIEERETYKEFQEWFNSLSKEEQDRWLKNFIG